MAGDKPQPPSCFAQLEGLLQRVSEYADDDAADKSVFVGDMRARLFSTMAALISHPLGDNMALPFARQRATDCAEKQLR